MRNILHKSGVVIALSFLVMNPAKAFLGMGDVVTDPVLTMKSMAAEAARLGQTATMIQNQINEYQNMIYNTVTLANPVLKPIGDLARTAANTYYQSQNLMYRAQNINQAYGMMYPSYMNYQSYAMNVGRGGQTLESKYQGWSDKNNDNVRSALQAANIEATNQENDSSMIDKLVQQSSGTGGQMQAIQGLGQIMGHQSSQMSGLNSLMLTQVRLWSNYIGAENERRSAFDASDQQFRSTRPMNSPAMGF
jgi:type IV secretion system protein TrbJ